MPDEPLVRVVSVNVGRIVRLKAGERTVASAIGKRGVTGRVAVTAMGLAGDEQADPTVHGGLEKAVYAYPAEHYPFWEAQRRERQVSLFDEALPHGFAGENLTLSGLVEHEVWLGDRLVFPACVLEVTQPRSPCFKFNTVMGFAGAVRAMVHSGFCGWYLRVLEGGSVQAGEACVLEAGPRALRISDCFAGQRARLLR